MSVSTPAGACLHLCRVASHGASSPTTLCRLVTLCPHGPRGRPVTVRPHLWSVLRPTRHHTWPAPSLPWGLPADSRSPRPSTGPGSARGSSPQPQWWRSWLDHATGTAPTWPALAALSELLCARQASHTLAAVSAGTEGARPALTWPAPPGAPCSCRFPAEPRCRRATSPTTRSVVSFLTRGLGRLDPRCRSALPLLFTPCPHAFLSPSLVPCHCSRPCPVHVPQSPGVPLTASCPRGHRWGEGGMQALVQGRRLLRESSMARQCSQTHPEPRRQT